MLASKLIEKLQEQIKRNGDARVSIYIENATILDCNVNYDIKSIATITTNELNSKLKRYELHLDEDKE